MTYQGGSADERTFFSDNALKLGVFCLNVSGGMMLSGAAKRTLDWDENVAVSKVAVLKSARGRITPASDDGASTIQSAESREDA